MSFDDARARLALRAIFDAAVAAADPRVVLAAHLPPKPTGGRVVVVGGGKSAAVMAAAGLGMPSDLHAAGPGAPGSASVVLLRLGVPSPVK